MYKYELKIPLGRIAVLIGEKGSIKRKIQNSLDIKIKVDSKEGDVVIYGEDNINLLIAYKIVKAVGRGFNPEVALKLLNEDYVFELIDMSEYGRKTKNDMIRLRGRAIGEKGRCRKIISNLMNVNICVYGKTIGIIGRYDDVDIVKRAFDKLLKGSPHGKVFRFIYQEKEKQKIDL